MIPDEATDTEFLGWVEWKCQTALDQSNDGPFGWDHRVQLRGHQHARLYRLAGLDLQWREEPAHYSHFVITLYPDMLTPLVAKAKELGVEVVPYEPPEGWGETFKAEVG